MMMRRVPFGIFKSVKAMASLPGTVWMSKSTFFPPDRSLSHWRSRRWPRCRFPASRVGPRARFPGSQPAPGGHVQISIASAASVQVIVFIVSSSFCNVISIYVSDLLLLAAITRPFTLKTFHWRSSMRGPPPRR